MAQKLNGNAPKGQLDSVKIAGSWLDFGIQPVPIKRRSKQPKMKKGWNGLRVSMESIPRYFKTGDNVGGLWGEASGWIVDVDLDWDEASAAAPRLLPETFVYGRRKRPGSHYLYQVTGIGGSKRYDAGAGEKAARTVIAEIRSSGSQSVLPPSRHPDGDRYEINHDVPIKAMTPKALEQLVDKVSAAALFARYYPEKHGRHDYMHAMAGGLLWEGWNDDEVTNFCMAVLDAVDRKEDDRKQRERTVKNTIEHFREGNRIAGWKTLSQWMHGEDLRLIKQWIRATKNYEVVQVPFKQKEEKRFEEDLGKLYQVPGMVGDIAKWAGQRAFLVQPMFDLSVGLMCTALATMNRYLVDGWDTPLQPYFMLLAPSSGGKESAMDSIITFARKVGIIEHVFQGYQSYHSMLDRLGTPPNVSLWLLDEAARKLRNAGKSMGGPDYQIITWLLSLYGKANSFSPGIPGRKNAIQAIVNPFFLTMAASQPAQILEAITDSDMAQGFVNRFILFDGGDRIPEANLNRSNIFPSKFEQFYKTIRSVPTPTGDNPFTHVKFENVKVANAFRDFDYEARKNAFEAEGTATWGRANQNALILAGIVAVGVNPKLPLITEPVVEWAVRFIRWSIKHWRERTEQSSSRTVVELRSKTVERYITNPSNWAHRATGKMKQIMLGGQMPRSVLVRLCRHLSARDLDDVLHTLTGGEMIGAGELDGIEVYWAKRPND